MLTFIEKLGVLQERRRREKTCGWTPQQLANHQQRALEGLRAFAHGHSDADSPNVFHRVLESVPASAWQVVQQADGLIVNLVGLKAPVSEMIRIESMCVTLSRVKAPC